MTTQRWPTAWLMTDERLGDALDEAMVRAAAAGAGILVRHHRATRAERRSLAERVVALGAPLGMARDVALAEEMGALLVHNPGADTGALAFSLSVHDDVQAAAAASRRPALVFVSPIYPTRSHLGAPALGEVEALRLAARSEAPAIALGGVDQVRGERLMNLGFHGWAGIDAWLRT
ncbi:thiamine phosphate synthase [Sphingomonas swuensis]|uniref:Thiamine phosphate synthase n=1 Tax=Sphingomonas swuensis TaxID=977800 RepID=A0ABP7S975_9SPHN